VISESAIVCQVEPENPKIVVFGVDTAASLKWENCEGNAGESITTVFFKRQKLDDVKQDVIASRGPSTGFTVKDPFKDKYKASLDQELRILKIQTNDEYVYTLSISFEISPGNFGVKDFQVTVLVKGK
jgi:hypothetical protein